MKINLEKKKKFILLSFSLALGIILLYGSNIISLNTVLELGDEAGYLWNAAYFTGTDWNSISSVYPYFGYGYSVLLIPLFLITNHGIWLIKGACVINIICVLGIYFIIIKLLYDVDKRSPLIMPVIAFLACIMPYMATSTLKVICEVFLTFWYSLLVLLLYMLLKTNKRMNAILLGIVGAFIFFIHTRAIVVIGMLTVTLVIAAVSKQIKYKNLICFLLFGIVAFLGFYWVKADIRSFKYGMLNPGETVTTGNMLTSDFILARIQWFLEAPENVIAVFGAKIFYSVIATGLVLIPGILVIGKQLWRRSRKGCCIERTREETAGLMTKGFIIITYIIMVAACAGSGTGSNIQYAFYGRYYEFTLPILFSFCLYFFLNERIDKREMFLYIVFVIGIGIETWKWCMSYLPDQSFGVDTARLAAFTRSITVNKNLDGVMGYLIITAFLLLILYTFFKDKKYGVAVIIGLVGIYLWSNTSLCIDTIQTRHRTAQGDTDIAEYILGQDDVKKIYMIDDNSYKYQYFYARMQVLLKDKKLYVITPDDYGEIEDGVYIITYANTELKNTILSDTDFLKSGNVFELYSK